MIHPIKSIISRQQKWSSKHFEKTKYGKQITALKDSHKGEKCFVLGNGPSLSAKDLDVLNEKNVITFATNRIFNVFDTTDWRPTYYVGEDIDVIRNVSNEINSIEIKHKFIPINLKWYEDYQIDNADYFYMTYKKGFMKENFDLSVNAAHEVACRGTVTSTCIQLAIYMGFSEIYLLGVDHSFSKMVDKHGNLIENDSIKDHFDSEKRTDVANTAFNIDDATQAFIDVEKLSDKLETFRVYNATRGGKLEVFERVDFDKLMEDWNI